MLALLLTLISIDSLKWIQTRLDMESTVYSS